MTNQEFSDEFDVMLNSYDNLPFRIILDEYEKSVFLTSAQESIIKSIYGENGGMFEKTEMIRRALSKLVTSYDTNMLHNITYFKDAYSIILPDDLLYIVLEWADTETNINVEVTPITMDEYHRISKNPFRGTTNTRILRMDQDSEIILISKNKPVKYYCEYIKKPNPIVLINLPDGLSINDITTESTTDVDESLHRDILLRAVEMAVKYKTLGLQKNNDNNKSQE